ncbi:MarR family transcriptional regulator [Pseudonocardia eucalypti]|uniref:MarR family transcriptional regulator n=2 Tax=Pseudonocardia eucalypti TaxID=648755 RepID=A0ABP9PJ94_9PSEU
MRGLRNQLSLLNQQVSGRLTIKNLDLDCLELVAMHGPLSPSALARRAGVHPATLTGILDRLQRGGWITRDRPADGDPDTDRRTVTVRALPDRNHELFGLYAGMSAAMDRICADYSPAELELLAGFLRRMTEAGHEATEHLTSG